MNSMAVEQFTLFVCALRSVCRESFRCLGFSQASARTWRIFVRVINWGMGGVVCYVHAIHTNKREHACVNAELHGLTKLANSVHNACTGILIKLCCVYKLWSSFSVARRCLIRHSQKSHTAIAHTNTLWHVLFDRLSGSGNNFKNFNFRAILF